MDVNYVRIQIIDLYPPTCRRRPSCKVSAGSKSCLNVSLSQGRSPMETQIFLFLVYNHFKELSKIPSENDFSKLGMRCLVSPMGDDYEGRVNEECKGIHTYM